MKNTKYFVAAVFSMALVSSVSFAQDKSTDGKKIFEANKCNMCHSMKAENIQATGKSKAPDLSEVGSTQKAEWIQKFVKKNEELEGKKHPIMFKGTDAELKTLSTWLASHSKKSGK
ncbi:MAG: c-type cytochrome [Ignavibacteriales bacterium]